MRTLSRLVLLALLLASSACIRRAPTPESRRARISRQGLQSVILANAPAYMKSFNAKFDKQIALEGIDWSPQSFQPGDTIQVTFYYRVLDLLSEDYRVFIHAEVAGTKQRYNIDHSPAEGRYPTSVWQAGELIADRWSFTIPKSAAGGKLEFWTGFFNPDKEDERLPLSNRTEVRNDGNNRVLALVFQLGGEKAP